MKRVVLCALLTLGIAASALPAGAVPIRILELPGPGVGVTIGQPHTVDLFPGDSRMLTDTCVTKVNLGYPGVGVWVKPADFASNRECFRSVEASMVQQHGRKYRGVARVMQRAYAVSRAYLDDTYSYYDGTVPVTEYRVGDAIITGIIEDGEIWIAIQ